MTNSGNPASQVAAALTSLIAATEAYSAWVEDRIEAAKTGDRADPRHFSILQRQSAYAERLLAALKGDIQEQVGEIVEQVQALGQADQRRGFV